MCPLSPLASSNLYVRFNTRRYMLIHTFHLYMGGVERVNAVIILSLPIQKGSIAKSLTSNREVVRTRMG